MINKELHECLRKYGFTLLLRSEISFKLCNFERIFKVNPEIHSYSCDYLLQKSPNHGMGSNFCTETTPTFFC